MRISEIVITLCLTQGLLGQNTNSTTLANSVNIPNLETQADFAAWEKEVEQAVKEIEEGKGRSRSYIGDKIEKIVSGFFAETAANLKCGACKVGVGATSRVSRWSFTRPHFINAIGKLCQVAVNKPKSVCQGIASSSGGSALDVFSQADLDNDFFRPAACFALGNLCPSPEVPLKALTLPPRTQSTVPKATPNNYKYILQISDLHYDADYKVGSEAECKKPICCQADSNSDEKNPNSVKRPASIWGDYNCDANEVLLKSLLSESAIVGTELNYDMVLFTGDVPAHDMWKEAISRTTATETAAFSFIDTYLNRGTTKLYPSIGNHESVPVNEFPLKGQKGADSYFLYKFIADQWKNWLPSSTQKTLVDRGFYSVQHNKNLKVISLNNNIYYTLNFRNLLDISNPDPNGMFAWLISELNEAETSGSMVYLTSHIPPGSKDFYAHWSKQYYQIVQRYSHILAGQFYGHDHSDSFEVFYSGPSKNKKTALSVGYLAPSMTTFNGQNPGFRVYKVDASTYQVVDYTQYYADLKKANEPNQSLKWEVLYSARDLYGAYSSDYELDGEFWHSATEALSSNKALFDTYFQFRNKKGRAQKVCDAKCKDQTICTLRAGYSKDNCTPFEF